MPQDKHRFQLDLLLDDAEANALLRLMKAFETSDVSEVLARALAFQDLCIKAVSTDHTLVCRNADGEEREIALEARQSSAMH